MISWIETPTLEISDVLMKKVDLIMATGGAGMVHAAYSSGTPAIGVGPGNCNVVIDKSADLRMAVESIIHSKTFDNGMQGENQLQRGFLEVNLSTLPVRITDLLQQHNGSNYAQSNHQDDEKRTANFHVVNGLVAGRQNLHIDCGADGRGNGHGLQSRQGIHHRPPGAAQR